MKAGSQKDMGVRLSKYVIQPNGCWYWMGAKDRDGYGRMVGSYMGERKFIRAHRASFEYHKSKLAPDQHVLHTCDNPSCINPDHLYAGDAQANSDDKWNRKRGRVGVLVGPANPMYGKVGPLNPFFGKRHTEESKQKMRISKRKTK